MFRGKVRLKNIFIQIPMSGVCITFDNKFHKEQTSKFTTLHPVYVHAI